MGYLRGGSESSFLVAGFRYEARCFFAVDPDFPMSNGRSQSLSH